jgi:hypothetical protein
MLAEDVCTYLVATTSLGLTARSSGSGNLYALPFPESSPDASTCVVEYAATPPTRAMGDSLAAPVCENVRFQVTTRVTSTDYATGRALMEDIYVNLDNLYSTASIGSTGSTRYLQVRALDGPAWIGQDESKRHRFACNFEARKERG